MTTKFEIDHIARMNAIMNALDIPAQARDEYSKTPTLREDLRNRFTFGEFLHATIAATGFGSNQQSLGALAVVMRMDGPAPESSDQPNLLSHYLAHPREFPNYRIGEIGSHIANNLGRNFDYSKLEKKKLPLKGQVVTPSASSAPADPTSALVKIFLESAMVSDTSPYEGKNLREAFDTLLESSKILHRAVVKAWYNITSVEKSDANRFNELFEDADNDLAASLGKVVGEVIAAEAAKAAATPAKEKTKKEPRPKPEKTGANTPTPPNPRARDDSSKIFGKALQWHRVNAGMGVKDFMKSFEGVAIAPKTWESVEGGYPGSLGVEKKQVVLSALGYSGETAEQDMTKQAMLYASWFTPRNFSAAINKVTTNEFLVHGRTPDWKKYNLGEASAAVLSKQSSLPRADLIGKFLGALECKSMEELFTKGGIEKPETPDISMAPQIFGISGLGLRSSAG